MYNLIIIVLCFITILLIRKRIKNKPTQFEIKPAEEAPRKGFTLPWISQAASTVNALVIVIPNKATKLDKLGVWGSVVIAFCATVTLVLDHLDGLVSLFGRMFT